MYRVYYKHIKVISDYTIIKLGTYIMTLCLYNTYVYKYMSHAIIIPGFLGRIMTFPFDIKIKLYRIIMGNNEKRIRENQNL